jgi:hypothetical protein
VFTALTGLSARRCEFSFDREGSRLGSKCELAYAFGLKVIELVRADRISGNESSKRVQGWGAKLPDVELGIRRFYADRPPESALSWQDANQPDPDEQPYCLAR